MDLSKQDLGMFGLRPPVKLNARRHGRDMELLDSNKSRDVNALALALADAPAKGTTLLRLSQKTQLPVSRVGKLLEKHHDYFVNIGGSGLYGLNRFGPHKGDPQAIVDSIDQKAQAASNRRKLAAAVLLIAFVLFVLAR